MPISPPPPVVGTKASDEQPTHGSLSIPKGRCFDHRRHSFTTKTFNIMMHRARRKNHAGAASNQRPEVITGPRRQESAHPSGQKEYGHYMEHIEGAQ